MHVLLILHANSQLRLIYRAHLKNVIVGLHLYILIGCFLEKNEVWDPTKVIFVRFTSLQLGIFCFVLQRL